VTMKVKVLFQIYLDANISKPLRDRGSVPMEIGNGVWRLNGDLIASQDDGPAEVCTMCVLFLLEKAVKLH